MIHSFNLKLAEKYGIEQAILIEQIYWWIHKNDCEEIEEMCHEGKVWCRSTAKGFAKYVPYIKPKKIWSILRKLEGKVLLIGNFNKNALNQTLWYTFTDDFKKELAGLDYDFPKKENAISKKGKCINTINSINIDNTIQESEKRLSNDNQKKEEYSKEFEEFWKVYGFCRGKGETYKRWKKLSIKEKKEALSALPAYFADCKANNRQKRYPSVYISKRTWEDDFTPVEAEEQENNKQPNGLPVGLTEGRWHKFQSWGKKNIPSIIDNITPCMFLDMQRESCFRTGIMAKVLCDMEKKPSTGELLQEFIVLCEGKYSEDIKKSIGLT